jgi:hypothetical protein
MCHHVSVRLLHLRLTLGISVKATLKLERCILVFLNAKTRVFHPRRSFPTPDEHWFRGGWKIDFQPLIFGQKSNPRFWKIREAPSRSEGPPLHPSIFFRSQPSSPAHYSPSRQAARASVDFLERRLALPVLLDTLRASRHGTGLPNGPKRPIQ